MQLYYTFQYWYDELLENYKEISFTLSHISSWTFFYKGFV